MKVYEVGDTDSSGPMSRWNGAGKTHTVSASAIDYGDSQTFPVSIFSSTNGSRNLFGIAAPEMVTAVSGLKITT